MIGIRRAAVISEAKKWVGVPYRHLGKSKESGVDCIGLITEVSKVFGLSLKAPEAYSDHPSGDMLLRHANAQLKPVAQGTESKNHLKTGTIMMLWTFSAKEPQHFGWYDDTEGRPMIIHAFAKENRVCHHGMDNFWIKRLVAVYDLPNLED
jgi:cell wall-associated NlpC family hydrolase